jgi:AAA ATPase domain
VILSGLKYSSGVTSIRPRRRFPGTLSNVPISVPLHFIGRDDTLTAIETALKRYEGRVAIAALHGLGGVGKTTLASAYAERHCGYYGEPGGPRRKRNRPYGPILSRLAFDWVGSADDKEEPAIEAMMDRLRPAMAAGRKGRQSAGRIEGNVVTP